MDIQALLLKHSGCLLSRYPPYKSRSIVPDSTVFVPLLLCYATRAVMDFGVRRVYTHCFTLGHISVNIRVHQFGL